uniref:Alpha-2-macroglobulin n=1 Tax=Dugesia japonica TaxID=6161 RepID=A0A4Y6HTR9_DUGJA|nr:alpha-2-macroglobulin [Dugesia japonica]
MIKYRFSSFILVLDVLDMKLLISLTILILFSTESFGIKDFYFITTPNLLLVEAPHQFNVHTSTDLVLTIDSIHTPSKINHQSSNYIIQKGFDSIPYYVPFIGSHVGSKITLNFLGDFCSDLLKCKSVTNVTGNFINETREIGLIDKNFIIFAETDKPIYKPGEKIKFRFMPIYPTNLMREPEDIGDQKEIILNKNNKFEWVLVKDKNMSQIFELIFIENPTGARVAQWINVSLAKAMDLRYQLTNDPVFGTWKSKATFDGQEELIQFEVKRYVLPRFVVTVNPPKEILANQKSIGFKVCSKYSTGKTMKAQIHGTFCMHHTDKTRNCEYFKSTLLKQSCNRIDIDTKSIFNLKSKSRFTRTKSVINVTVIENGTSSVVSKVVEGSGIMYTSFAIKFVSKLYYKPGLPYFGQLKLVRHNNKPASNINVSIDLENWAYGQGWGFHRIYTSNKEGIVDFIVPNIPLEQSVTVRVNEVSNDIKAPMSAATLYQSIANWESVDKYYMQFLPLNSKVKCPDDLNLTIVTNYDISEINMYVQIFSRGRITDMIEYPSIPVKCFPRNDFFGHYECVNGTVLVCLPGWKGGNCREPICVGGCLNGACVEPNKCICKAYWKGENCDQCIIAPYCKNGYCKNGNDCKCYPGWQSFDCSKKGPKVHSYENYSTIMPTSVKQTEIKKFEKQTVFERIITVPLLKNMGPDVHIIIYFITPNNEVVADSIELSNGLKNCSHLGGGKFKFDRKTTVPKTKVVLTLDPGVKDSSCSVRIADIALSQFGKSSNVDLAYLIQKLINLNHKITVDNRFSFGTKRLCVSKDRVKKSIWPGYRSGYDSRKVLATSGFTAITNARIINAKCLLFAARGSVNKDRVVATYVQKTLKTEVNKKIRENFPESWLFAYFNKTNKLLNLTVPDSMTTWKADAYCMTERGLWIAPTQKLKVILPFFANIYVPYSIKLDEQLSVPVKIFNYASACYEIYVKINVESEEINVIGLKSFTLCVCSNDEKTLYFKIQPKIIGKLNITVDSISKYSTFCSEDQLKTNIEMSDSIRRQLLVEPSGVPTETTFSELICNKNEQLGIVNVFTIPTTIVPGSLRSYVTFNGDVMGQTFDNLDKLVKMPYGCGEQNMVAVVPSIYVLEYLTNLKIVNPILISKAEGYIINGYNRQLLYKHEDGSFSAFGKSDKAGSTWLTAFVLRSFNAANKYVKLNSSMLTDAVKYLEKMQQNNGCFKENGKLFSSTMAGGVKKNDNTDEALLTAYVLISLKDIKSKTIKIDKAIKCITANISQNPSNYRLALSAYALSIYQNSSNATENVIQQLRTQATEIGRYRYWLFDKDAMEESKTTSSDIETTGYALLAMQNSQSLFDSLKTIYWLSNQRNSLGGYYSTQDTVVALSVLATFAETIGLSNNVNLNLSITLNNEKNYNDLITTDNRLVSRTFNLGAENISYISIKTNGTGCVSVQLISLYNIQKLYSAKETFKLSVKPEIISVEQCNIRKIKICFSYLRRDKDSNMILLIINYPSGWELTEDEEKSVKLQITTPLNRIDFQKSKMELYYDAFSYNDAGKDSCFRFQLEEKSKISNLQPSLIKLMDYYNPDIYTETSYSMFNKDCNSSDVKIPEIPKVLLCPICVNDSLESTVNFIQSICQSWFQGFVTDDEDGIKNRIIYESKQSFFNEWKLDIEPMNCSCLKTWKNLNNSFIVLSSKWKYLSEKLILSNDSVMYPINTLYSSFKYDLQNQCRMAKNLYMMMNRLLPDFANKTEQNNSCPSCILGSNYYFKIQNLTSWYCANYTDWNLTISYLSPIITGILKNNISSINVEIEFSNRFCYCFEQIRDLKKSFRIVDLKNQIPVIDNKSNKPFKLLLNNDYEVIENNVFLWNKHIKCGK